MTVTARQAANIMKGVLAERGISGVVPRGRTVHFTDLARASAVFVRLQGWEAAKHGHLWDDLAQEAKAHGFILEG